MLNEAKMLVLPGSGAASTVSIMEKIFVDIYIWH